MEAHHHTAPPSPPSMGTYCPAQCSSRPWAGDVLTRALLASSSAEQGQLRCAQRYVIHTFWVCTDGVGEDVLEGELTLVSWKAVQVRSVGHAGAGLQG